MNQVFVKVTILVGCSFYLTFNNLRRDDPTSKREMGSEDENHERQFKSQITRSSDVRQTRSRRGGSSRGISNLARPQGEDNAQVSNELGYTYEESKSLADLENQIDELLKDDQKKNSDLKKYYASIRTLRKKTLRTREEAHHREDLAQLAEGQVVLVGEENVDDPEMKVIHDLVNSDRGNLSERQQVRDLLRARSQRLSKLQESQD